MTDAGPVDEADALAGTEQAARRGAAERMVFFSDAVVAIAITLLALELPVPTGDSSAAVFAELRAESFTYLTFVISFLVVGAHWRAHHRVFRYLGSVDDRFVTFSLAWLLVIVATPFLTEVLRNGNGLLRFGLYAAAQALLLLIFAAMQSHAGRRGLFVPGTPTEITHESWGNALAGPLGFLVSIPLQPLLGGWAFALWAAGPNLLQLGRSLSAAVGRWRRGRRPPPSRG